MSLSRLALAAVTGLTAAAVLGCSEQRESGDEARSAHDSAGVAIVENGFVDRAPAWTLGPEPLLVIGGDEADEDARLDRASSAARLPDGGVAIANSGSGQIFLFGPDGARFAVLGGAGQGPGEFGPFPLFITSVADGVLVEQPGPNPKLVWFLDDGGLRTTTFPAEGVPRGICLDRTTSTRGTLFALCEPPFALQGPASDVVRGVASGVRSTFDGQGPDTVGRYRGTELFYADVGPRPTLGGGQANGPRAIAPLFPATSRLAGGGDPWRVVIGDQAASAFDVYREDGRLTLRVRWRAPRRAASAEDRARAEAAFLDARRDDASSARRAVAAMPDRSDVAVFDELVVGRDGRVWVRRYGLPTDANAEWWVFQVDGRLVGRVALPPAAQLLEAAEDHVVVKETDELDIERVELWPLLTG